MVITKGDIDMKARIDREGCISCGLCADTCPEVFRMADDGFAKVYVDAIPTENEAAAQEAQENCPVSVITVE
jgi:ferredoxin